MAASHHSGRASRRGVVICVAAVVLAGVAATAHAASGVWNVDRIGGPRTADATVIAVIDSGLDGSHVAFGDRVLPQVDFVDDGRSGDPDGHGTHVAGTAAGGTIDCGSGPVAVGVASTAEILPIRVLDADGRGTVDDVVAGIRHAADRGAEVVNLSLGTDITLIGGAGATFVDALEYAWSKGAVPVLAAGNAGVLGSLFGSGYGDIPAVVVTATTRADRKASYATAVGSARWAVAAPGGDGSRTAAGDVLSAWPDSQCALLAGTSMAAPHVSGALAVLRARGLDPQRAVDRLLATADPVSPASTYGAGIVNLTRATDGLGGAVTPPTTTPSTVVAVTTRPPSPGTPTTVADPPVSAPTTTSTTMAPRTTPVSEPGSGGQDDAELAPAPTTTAPEQETAAGASTVRDEDERRPDGRLVAAAALSVVALWVLASRAALRLRDRPEDADGAGQP